MDFSEDNVFPAGPCDIDSAVVIPATLYDDEVWFLRLNRFEMFFEHVSIWEADVYPSWEAMMDYMESKLRVVGMTIPVLPYADAVIRTMLVARG